MHAVDHDLDSRVGERGTGEHRVHRFDGLAFLALAGGQDRLCNELATKHDVVPEVDVGGAVAVGLRRFEGQRFEERIDGGHDDSFSLSLLLARPRRDAQGPYTTGPTPCDSHGAGAPRRDGCPRGQTGGLPSLRHCAERSNPPEGALQHLCK